MFKIKNCVNGEIREIDLISSKDCEDSESLAEYLDANNNEYVKIDGYFIDVQDPAFAVDPVKWAQVKQ